MNFLIIFRTQESLIEVVYQRNYYYIPRDAEAQKISWQNIESVFKVLSETITNKTSKSRITLYIIKLIEIKLSNRFVGSYTERKFTIVTR